MGVRDKLVGLIKKVPYGIGVGAKFEQHFCEKVADHLIANGVTVNEWVSVKDRLPTAEDASVNGSVYAFTKAKKVQILRYQYVCQFAKYMHCWMPISLPQPPKGE